MTLEFVGQQKFKSSMVWLVWLEPRQDLLIGGWSYAEEADKQALVIPGAGRDDMDAMYRVAR